MSVDFTKDACVLTVHGVQTSSNKDIKSDQQITKLVNKSLSDSHLQRNFEVAGYFYEDKNDNAQKVYQYVGKAISSNSPLAGQVLKNVIDLVGDVIIAANNTSTAALIKKDLRSKILESYEQQKQLVLVAHSLGTIYSLDVICDLMKEDGLFNGDDKTTWPVQGFITMGSPLGLDTNILGTAIFEKRNVQPLRNANYTVFPWHNYFNRLDPVVSGDLFGRPMKITGAKGPLEKRYGDDTKAANWLLQGHAITSGKQWMFAHTSYWKNSKIGDQIVNMLWD